MESTDDERSFAAAVARGDRSAVATFEREYIAPLDHSLAKMRLDAATLDEVRQRVRERLLLRGEEGVTRLEAYAGQGKLKGLVHVTASRIAVDLLRAKKSEPIAHREPAAVDAGEDPLLAAMKRGTRDAFKVAFERAIDGLETRDRNVLKLHLLRGVSLEKLAEMYGVHRATVVRWIAAARASVLAATRRAMAQTLGADAEVDSALALLESQLDASVERVFRTRNE